MTLESDEPEPEEPIYEVWADNWPALDLFLRCQTQWRVGGSGGVIGLDYVAVAAVGSMIPSDDPLARMEDLQVIETRLLDLFAENARRNAARQRGEKS